MALALKLQHEWEPRGGKLFAGDLHCIDLGPFCLSFA
jgi:hypothetical protein